MSPGGANIFMSATVTSTSFLDSHGYPTTNISQYSKLLDFIQIQNMDMGGPSSLGPNAPLNDSCDSNEKDKLGSALSAVNAWTKAGMESTQIVLGVPAYGKGYVVTNTSAIDSQGNIVSFPSFNQTLLSNGSVVNTTTTGSDVCREKQQLESEDTCPDAIFFTELTSKQADTHFGR